MSEIELNKQNHGKKASEVSKNLLYNFNALLSEIQALKSEIN